MSCSPYIIPADIILSGDDPVSLAASRVAANAYGPVPVVDAERRLIGLFGPRELAGLLLPMGARLAGDGFALGFVSETPAALRERLGSAAADPVARHTAEHRPLQTSTSLDEALLRMHRGATVQVAVDDDGRVIGLLTAATVLNPLVGG